ncbi:adenine deaminase [Echinicola pacifica]|uniref:Adenine deaminase n=1 Tax=Echinicola pacifica TaxID=346377 RepID=A0A918URQ3_9BACT|nr:adenine deaminase [Echinicola pacifica]GGZ28777.1 adenine deaminase [Echinicola pacifica]
MTDTFFIEGQLVDIRKKCIYPARINVQNTKIIAITPIEQAPDVYILPGFVDAHVHIESSMLVPSEFAKIAVTHGTVATVSDPHEIANVCGMEGIDFMIKNGQTVNFHFNFGAPSCVPATIFETAGSQISVEDIDTLLARKEIGYLAEMMNWPGTIHRDPDVMSKIHLAQKYGKPVDGHAPGLRGEQAKAYASAGISTDHECFTEAEALDKLALGMKILIREGSAAKNFEALVGLFDEYHDSLMFCSDDKHPDNLVEGHINQLAARAVAAGKDLYQVLQAACINPVDHYKMEVGTLQIGDPADFIICSDLTSFMVRETYIKGQKVAENGQSLINTTEARPINNFHANPKNPEDFNLPSTSDDIRVIVVEDGQLITKSAQGKGQLRQGNIEANVEEDILKIVVVNRYADAPPAIAFIKGFGLKEGAIGSSVAHDSHNIIAVGLDNESICEAINLIIASQGGLSVVSEAAKKVLPLPVAGLMSTESAEIVAKKYEALDQLSKKMGTTLAAPFMSLSFMALLVIPSLKLSDKGLFDGENFKFISPFT